MKNKFLKISLGLILLYLVAAFVGSSLFSIANQDSSAFKTEEIVEYASKYLTNEYLIIKGTRIDCSGYTNEVYGFFDYELPESAIKQYKLFKTDSKITKPADLVFFAINSKQIDHVGFLLNDSTFIHSPGINKAVRIDKLNSKYWLQYYMGIGRVINKD